MTSVNLEEALAEANELEPPRIRVSVLVPTRGRPREAWRMAGSALDTASSVESVEVLLGVDADDPEYHEYLRLQLENSGRNINCIVVPQGWTVSQIWNHLWKLSEGRVFLMGNDDQLFKTLDWDLRLLEVDRSYPDGIYVAWFNDMVNGATHCAFPCVSRTWTETLGYFAPEVGFRFFRNDTWAYDLGLRVGRTHYLDDVVIEHLHWSKGGVKDDTTRRNRDGGQSQDDQRKWVATESVRAEHALKLKEVIKRWQT